MTFRISFRGMMAVKFLTSFILGLAMYTAAAQVVQSGRFEVEQKSSAYDFTVVSMNERGVGLIHQLNKFFGAENTYEFIHLDTALKKVWSTEIKIKSHFTLIGYEYADDQVYYLFRKGNNDYDGFFLTRFDTDNHLTSEYDIETKLAFKITHFSIIGKSALLGGYVSRQPSVILCDFTAGNSKVVPGFFVKNTELIDLRTNKNATFNALLMDRSSTEKKQLVIRTMDETGAIIVDDMVEVDGDKSILSGITSTLERDELMVAGAWGSANGKTALGIYTLVVDPFNKQQITYYAFSEFNRLLDIYVPNKASRIKARSARKKKAGKLPGFSLSINPARMAEGAEGFSFLFEIYSPSAGSNSNWNYANPVGTPYAYGGGYPYGTAPYYNRYSPYSYGNSFSRSDVIVRFSAVALFDAEGKLLDDTGQKVNDVKLDGIDQISDFVTTRNQIVMLHRDEKQVYVNITERGENAAPENSVQPIQLVHDTDILRHESKNEGSMRYWFGKSLFLWGYESIKEQNEYGSHRVFYVNKFRLAH